MIKMTVPRLTEGRGATLQTDTEPYLTKQTPQGDRELLSLVGGTVAWNQLCNSSSVTVTSGHKYIMRKSGATSVGNSNGSALTGLTSGSDMVIDLTQMFGSTIADYIYTLEQGTAGAGVAWFRKLFPNDYYAYDAGSLLSVKTSGHVVTGKNLLNPIIYTGGSYNPNIGTQWTLSEAATQLTDNEDGTFSIDLGSWSARLFLFPLQKTKYYFYADFSADNMATTSGYLDADFKVLSVYNVTGAEFTRNLGITGTDEQRYFFLLFAPRSYAQTITITHPQIEYGETATAYEPYSQTTYPLSNIELRGIPKLVDNKLQYDGDSYESSGAVTRKYGTRAYQAGDATDGSTMVTDGTNTVYKLDTPTTETADAYTSPQTVKAGGSEQFVDERTVPMPVGNVSEYYNATFVNKVSMHANTDNIVIHMGVSEE